MNQIQRRNSRNHDTVTLYACALLGGFLQERDRQALKALWHWLTAQIFQLIEVERMYRRERIAFKRWRDYATQSRYNARHAPLTTRNESTPHELPRTSPASVYSDCEATPQSPYELGTLWVEPASEVECSLYTNLFDQYPILSNLWVWSPLMGGNVEVFTPTLAVITPAVQPDVQPVKAKRIRKAQPKQEVVTMAANKGQQKSRVKMPTIKAVAAELTARKIYLDKGDDVDVRLQVTDDGDWCVHTGDSSYDQDHRGHWGCGGMTKRTNCRDLARDLIDQCEESVAMSGD